MRVILKVLPRLRRTSGSCLDRNPDPAMLGDASRPLSYNPKSDKNYFPKMELEIMLGARPDPGPVTRADSDPEEFSDSGCWSSNHDLSPLTYVHR